MVWRKRLGIELLNSLLLPACFSNFKFYRKQDNNLDVKLSDLEGARKQFSATLDYDELVPHFEKALLDFRKKANIPGFRKGKAPLSMIKKLYEESVEQTSLDDIANDVYKDYVIKNEVDVIGTPVLKELDYEPKQKLSFSIEFEVMPAIENVTYKGLNLEKTIYEIDDSLIDDEIRYHRLKNSTRELDGAALDDEYIVTADLQNLDPDGNIIIGESQNNIAVYLGNKDMFPEFKKGFAGIKEGEVKVIDSNNAQGELKKVRITCTKVEKLIYPEMNSNFFKLVTNKEGIETEEEFRNEIRSELKRIYDGISARNFRDNVIGELLKINDVVAPDAFVDVILESSLRDYVSQFPKGQSPPGFDPDNFRKERRADAIRASRWHLLREKIAELEELKVEDSDLEKVAEADSERFGIPKDKLIELLKGDESYSMKLITDKVIDLVESNSNVTEKVELRTAEQAQNENQI